MTAILAVNFNHDGSGALLVDGRLVAFVNTERFSRLKKHPGIRQPDLDLLLAEAGLEAQDLDHVLLSNLHNMDSPDVVTLHGSDLKSTWFEFWINQRNDTVRIGNAEIDCTVNMDHHAMHAAAAYYTSTFESAAVLTIDPGECRAFLGRGSIVTPVAIDFGWFTSKEAYALVAHELFGTGIVGAGKVMGLAPYGDLGEFELGELDKISSYSDLRRLADRSPVVVEAGGRTLNATLAALVQAGLERHVSRALNELAVVAERNGIAPNLCLAGGTTLNAVANELGYQQSRFEQLHLHPASGDDGTAIGATLWHWHQLLGADRVDYSPDELMYNGLTYEQSAIDRAIEAQRSRLVVEQPSDIERHVAKLLADGEIVGWFEGGSEIGPRALGHRSMLADPRSPTMRAHLNLRVKMREDFRPFAPSVLAERAYDWFGISDSPYMLRTTKVRSSEVPAVTHVDGTSRIQTVDRAHSPRFHRLILQFEQLTGIPMVLNTSLNIRGEPIVETPEDAIRTLLESPIDAIAFPHVVVRRSDRETLGARS